MKKYLAVVFCFLFAISIRSSLACGPFFLTPIFVFDSRLENTEDFARGNIGIIQPTYYRSVLLVAYRTLNKLPFSAYEQKELVRDWQAEYEYVDNNEPIRTAAITHWLAARKKVLATGTAPEISTDRSFNNGYDVFLNCTVSAFDNATKTLAARIAEHGLTDKYVNQWVQAQDQVFANCSETNTVPDEANADAPAWVKNDRDYQIAAAYFYATNYDAAEKLFSAIAQNKSSPWRDTAVYLLSRVSLRKASAVSSDDSLDAQNQQARALVYYQQAEKQLNSILADPGLVQFHDSARQLLNLTTFRTNPEKLHNTLAKKLLATAENEHFYQDLTDYRWILDKVATPDAVNLRQKLRQQSDLTDWIFTLQRDENDGYALAVEKSLITNNKAWLVAFLTKANKDAFAHALEKWQATKNEAWLVASLIKATKDSPNLADLMTASKAVARSSPAFLTVNYYLVRLQIAQGQTDEPRKMIDSILSDKSLPLSVSTTNQLLSERLLLAQNLDEFVRFSQRHAAAFGFNGSDSELVNFAVIPKEGDDYYKKQRPWLSRSLFDTDATDIMNTLMPLSLLEKLAQHPDLPAYLKPKVMVSAWTRAVVLKEEKTALELAPETMSCIPELKNYMPAFIDAKNAKNRLFEADWLMLNNPAMRPVVDYGLERETGFSDIDDYRDNWWCNFKQADKSENGDASQLMAPVFLSPAELAEATAENATITKHASSGSNYLAAEASKWATQIPTEKRLPNALYLAVKATRYGCQNCETEKVSKAAFNILKARFGNTPWKKKTPYWFKDENCPTR
jgi:hypothetical protein